MAKNNEKYAYLDQLSTEQLEELLRVDFETDGSDNDGAIFHILEVIEKRERENPTGRLPDMERFWENFQRYYNIPEGEGCSLYPTGDESRGVSQAGAAAPPKGPSRRRWLRSVLAAAALTAVLLGSMVAAQASGFDIFGLLGRWTDETFHFVSADRSAGAGGTALTEEYYDAAQGVLEEWEAPSELIPTWYPAGYTAAEREITASITSSTLSLPFDGTDKFFSVSIFYYPDGTDRGSATFETDGHQVEEYISGSKLFYIFSNTDYITATWCDGRFMVVISGSLTIDEAKMIIDSMGGEVK